MSYQTSLSDSEWEIINSIHNDKRKRSHSLRTLWDAIFYLTTTGCQWRMLPKDLPPWQTVYYHYAQWRDRGLIEQVHDALVVKCRAAEGRTSTPSIAIVDGQSVKTAYSGLERGFDGGKRVKGRKRTIAVDALGLLLAVVVARANENDKSCLRHLSARMKQYAGSLQRIYADGGYESGPLSEWIAQKFRAVLQIVRRADESSEFRVLPKRWIVERTFGWLNNARRLSKDYEIRVESSEAFIHLAMIRLMLKRF